MEKLSSSSSSSSPSPCLELTIISAEDLRHNHRSIKKNAFVTVETDPSNPQSTSMDTDGGSYPSWNQKLELPLPYNAKHIKLDVKCKTTASGVKTIGSVYIPISDFLEDYVPPNFLHFLSYRVRERDGDRNGIVNVSIRVKGACNVPPRTLPQDGGYGYRNNSNACGMPASGSARPYWNGGRTAVGIPVSKGYPLVV